MPTAESRAASPRDGATAVELGARARPAAVGLSHRREVRPGVLSGGEPTASLDTRHAQEALELLCASARQGRQACVIVTHDVRLAAMADRVLHITDGALVPA